MKTKNKKICLLCILVLIFIGVLFLYYFLQRQSFVESAPEINGPQEIVVGYIADQSAGGTAAMGLSGLYGLEQRVQEINESGALLGRKIRIINRDDQADPELSKKQAEDLIFNEKVTAIIGPGNSENALNWIGIAQDNKVPVLVNISTATAITAKYADRPRNYIFSVSFTDLEQARLGVAWALYKTKNGDMAIIHDSTSYGRSGLKDVSEILGRWGKTPHIIKEFDRDASNEELAAMMMAVKESGADSVYLFALADSNIKLIKVMEAIGYDPVVVSTPSNLHPAVWEYLRDSAAKINFTVAFKNFDETAGVIKLRDDILKRHESLPTTTTASTTYNAMLLLEAAIKKSGSLDGTAIRDALEEVENIQGPFKFYQKPYDKENHSLITAWDLFMAHWVDGDIVATEDSFRDLDIR